MGTDHQAQASDFLRAHGAIPAKRRTLPEPPEVPFLPEPDMFWDTENYPDYDAIEDSYRQALIEDEGLL
jgi:hypothetical protein